MVNPVGLSVFTVLFGNGICLEIEVERIGNAWELFL